MILLAAAMMLLVGSEAQASTAAAPPPATAAQPPKAEASDKVICKREQATGSYMQTRVCHTQAEWNAEARDSQDELMRQQRGAGGPNGH
jgi:hypothetical protein